MKAILEVEFDENDMISKDDLKLFYNNDLLKCMKNLFKEDGIGIFDNELKLIDIKGDDDLLTK